MSSAKPRLVIYGVGQYGSLVTKFADAKGWPIVAAYNRVGDKIGEDLGQVAGLGKDLGVIVEDCDQADFSNLDADIGVVTVTNQLALNHDAHTRLLGAGLNVVCHGSQSYFPYGCNPDLAEELNTLAITNGVTFTGSGIWDMSRIWAGLLVAGPCTEIRSLYHSSITDLGDGQATKEQVAQLGVTLTVEEFMAKGLDKSPIAGSYVTIPQHVLAGLGFTLKDSQTRIEPVIFEQDYLSELMGCVIPAGHIVGFRVIANVQTTEGVTASAHIELREFHEGEVEHMFWSVDGEPATRIRTEREDSAHATAACLFNRIPDVINARAGVVTVSELGPLRPSL